MTALWDESFAGKEQRGRFVTGVTVARSELIDNDPESLARFMDAWDASVQAAFSRIPPPSPRRSWISEY